MRQNPTSLELQKDCEYIVVEAGKLLFASQDKFQTIEMKDEVDLATTADIEVEKLVINFIRSKYPSHAIFSEEAGNIKTESDYLWIIDPLDGTKDFVRGAREYNCLVAVEKKGALTAGAVQRNGINELYAASRGNGAYENGKRIKVSENTRLAVSSIGFHLPIRTSPKKCIDTCMKITKDLILKSYRIRPGWDDAKLLAYVANGVLDGNVMPSCLKNEWFDLAPALLLVEEAGGKITDWRGSPLQNHDISNGIVASNGKLHDQLLALLQTP